jgi:hypothetical protein
MAGAIPATEGTIMTNTDPIAMGGSNLLSRAMNLMFGPSAELARIAPEQETVPGFYAKWIVPLALIPVIAGAIGMVLFGAGIPGLAVMKFGPVQAAIIGVLQFVTILGMTYVMALLINALAPNFGAEQNPMQALKTAGYSGTAFCLAGVFQILPILSFLGLVGLYSIYILNRGVRTLMKAPEEKATGYTAAIVVIMLIGWIIVGALMSNVTSRVALGAVGGGALGGAIGEAANRGGSIEIGGANVDLGALEKAAKEMENAAKQMESGAVAGPAIELEKLKALLPTTLPAGFTRTELSTGSSGAMGMGMAGVNGIYTNGDKRVELSIADLGAMAGIAGMAGAFGVQGETENADGFSRVVTRDGVTTIEEVSKSANTAKYGRIIGGRFAVMAEGQNVTFDEVKAIAGQITPAQLEALVPKQ